GAKPWQTMLFVKLPLLWPSITLVAIISSISALQVFEEIFIMTHGKPLNASSTLVFQIYQTGLDTAGAMRMGYACAMGLVLFVILGIFTGFMMKTMHRFGYQAE
ncbi:MAG: sugar ABC transporter permease, partial [bacterium]